MAERHDSRVLNGFTFLAAIREGRRYPVLVLRGAEEFLLRQALDEYVAGAVDPAAADFDSNVFRSSEVSGEALWNALTTLPLLGSHRLVILELAGEPRKDVAEALERYKARPSPTTWFVIVAAEAGRMERPAELPSAVTVVEFGTLRENERMQWVETCVKARGMTMHRDALRYLIETSSASLSDIAAKLDHAILYLGDEREVTVQVLMKVSGVSSEHTVFDLERAILGRRSADAHRIARSLLEGGEVLLRLLAFHRGMIWKLWGAASVARKPDEWHRSPEGAKFWEELLKRQIFNKDMYLKAAKAVGVAQVRLAVLGLLELEVALKTGTQEPYRYYEWIWNITSESPRFLEPVFRHKS